MSSCVLCGEDGRIEQGVLKPESLPKGGRICYSCLDLDNLKAQIANTKTFLAHLEAHLEAVAHTYNHTHDHLTHQFPPEITARIFAFCLSGPSNPNDALHTTPFTLGAVCKCWRWVVWATPTLWAAVDIDLNKFESRFRARKELLTQWLKRSGKAPLAIRVTYHESDSWWTHRSHFEVVIDILNDYARRWEELDLAIPPKLVKRMSGYGSNKCMLKNLTLRPPECGHVDPSGVRWGSSTFEIAKALPRPEKVSLSGFEMRKVQIAWADVLEVYVRDIATVDAHCLLQAAPQLRNCTLRNVQHDADDNQFIEHDSITHSHLTVLDIGVEGLETMEILFTGMRCPNLMDVTLCYYDQPLDPFAQFITASRCTLTSLYLMGGDWSSETFDAQGMLHLLHATPTLETLALHIPCLPSTFFDLLATKASFLPLLCSFRYGPTGKLTFAWSAVTNAVTSRLAFRAIDGLPRLRSLDFQVLIAEERPSKYYIEELSVAHLLRLIERGVRLEIKNGVRDMLEYSRQLYEKVRFGVGEEPEESGGDSDVSERSTFRCGTS